MTVHPLGGPLTLTTVAMNAVRRDITRTTVTATVAADGAGNEQPEHPAPVRHLHTLMIVHEYSTSIVEHALHA